MSELKTKAVQYCRVSSKEQEETGYSLEAQANLLTDYAKDKYAVAKSFRVTESASKWQIRKTLKEMLDYTDKHGVDVILCEKIDRLTRSLKDAAVVDDWVQGKDSREVHFVKEHFVLNKNTRAHDNFVWDMKVAVARFYTNNLSEEVKKGQAAKLEEGWLPTKPPLGYMTTGEKGKKIHIVNEPKALLVKRMFELYATGNYSVKALVKKMNEEGLRNAGGTLITKSRLHELLSDPFYYGAIRWKGEIYEGSHEPLITKDMFDAVQTKLARKTASPLYRKHMPVFKAMIECKECSGTITWELQKGHWYGHCNHYRNCTQKKYVRQEAVEDQLFPYFDKAAPIHKDVLGVLEQALKESQSDEIAYNDSKRDTLNRIIIAADKRIAGAYRDKLDGVMPLDICHQVIKDSTAEKTSALHELEKLKDSRNAYYEAGLGIHELAIEAFKIYQSDKATVEDKRLLLSHMFTRHTMQEATIVPNYTFAFEFLAEWMPKVNKQFRTGKVGSAKGKSALSGAQTSTLLRG